MFSPNQAFLLVQKLKFSPKGFTLGVKAEPEKKKTFQSALPQGILCVGLLKK
jgi:hypothetical protein